MSQQQFHYFVAASTPASALALVLTDLREQGRTSYDHRTYAVGYDGRLEAQRLTAMGEPHAVLGTDGPGSRWYRIVGTSVETQGQLALPESQS